MRKPKSPPDLDAIWQQIKADPEVIAYYPGCSLHGTSQEFDMSVHEAMGALGVTLEEPAGWVCCGTTPAFIRAVHDALTHGG